MEDQVKTLEGSATKLASMGVKEASTLNRTKSLKDSMKPADKAMMEKMDEWSERMNRKARLGAMDTISKLNNAIHLIKKGALTGDKGASDGLAKVLEKMSQMGGQSTGKFLH